MARLPAAQLNAALDAMFPISTNHYLSFGATDPGTTGAGEWTGGRQLITWAAASGGSKASNVASVFTSIPAEPSGLPYFQVWDAAVGGNYKGGGTTTGLSGSLTAGDTITIASGATVWTAS